MPGRDRPRRGQRAPGRRLMSHSRGHPDPDRGRRRNGEERAAARASREADPSATGQPTAARESDPPIGRGGRASRPHGAGADRQTAPAQATGTGPAGAETPGTPPGRVEPSRPQATRRLGVATARGGATRHGCRTAGVISATRPPTASRRGARQRTRRPGERTSGHGWSDGSGSVTEPNGADGTIAPKRMASGDHWGSRPSRLHGCRGRARAASPPSTRRRAGGVVRGIGPPWARGTRWTTGRASAHGGETTGWWQRRATAAATPSSTRG